MQHEKKNAWMIFLLLSVAASACGLGTVMAAGATVSTPTKEKAPDAISTITLNSRRRISDYRVSTSGSENHLSANLVDLRPKPEIDGLSPDSTLAGGPAFTLTVNGDHFRRDCFLRWNGSQTPTRFVSRNQVTAEIAVADIAQPGTATITVSNIVPDGFTSNSVTFAIVNPIPTITSLSPNRVAARGPAFTLTVNGSDFVPASVVRWNGSNLETTFVSSSQLTAQVPAGNIARAGRATVTVSDPSAASNSQPVSILAAIAFDSNRALDGSDTSRDPLSDPRNIWFINSDGSGAVALTGHTTSGVGSISPLWSPDGSKIMFTSNRALDGTDNLNTNGTANLWVMNADGSEAVPLTRLTARGTNFDFSAPLGAWSPDGSKIAFVSAGALDGSDATNINTTTNIWVMNADGSNAVPLTKLTASLITGSSVPIWSPDGGKIAFISDRALDGGDAGSFPFTLNIWVMNADGSGARPLTALTARGAENNFYAWSPDGSKIAFTSSRALDGSDATNTTVNIWVMNADGSNATPLTKLTANLAGSCCPIWSPDGNKIAFSSERALDGSDAANTNDTANIWAMNVDGSGVAPLTNQTAPSAGAIFPLGARSPVVWSPDGSMIAFTSERALDGSDAVVDALVFNVWMINADSLTATPLTRHTANGEESQDSAWQP